MRRHEATCIKYGRGLATPPIFNIVAMEIVYSVANDQRPATASGVTNTIECGL